MGVTASACRTMGRAIPRTLARVMMPQPLPLVVHYSHDNAGIYLQMMDNLTAFLPPRMLLLLAVPAVNLHEAFRMHVNELNARQLCVVLCPVHAMWGRTSPHVDKRSKH